ASHILLRYGSITIVQVYVPGWRAVALTVADSFGPSDLLMLVLPSVEVPVHVTVDWVPPATSDVALAEMSVSGVSVNVTVLLAHVSPTWTVALWDVVSMSYPGGAAVSVTV